MTSLKCAAAAALSLFFGCGDECKHTEMTYLLGESSYTARYEKEEAYGIELDEVSLELTLNEHKPAAYMPPNKYIAKCSATPMQPVFEFFMVRLLKDGEWELIGFNNANDAYKLESRVMDAEELSRTESIRCTVALPYKIVGDGEFQKIQEYTPIGTIESKIKKADEQCFDDFYESRYIKDAEGIE